MERIMAKYAGATAMYFVSKKLKKKYNITDERESLYQAAETWVDALKDRPFLGKYILVLILFSMNNWQSYQAITCVTWTLELTFDTSMFYVSNSVKSWGIQICSQKWCVKVYYPCLSVEVPTLIREIDWYVS